MLAMLPNLLAVNTTGRSVCPCVTTPANISGDCFNATTTGCGEPICYPSSYGASVCATHDIGLAPYCDVAQPPDFCFEPWCYVDPEQCHSSVVPYEASSNGAGLYFSYETCGGDPTSWRQSELRDSLRFKVLRVAVPEASWPAHYMLDADGEPILGADVAFGQPPPEMHGYMVEWMDKLARRAGFTYEWRRISAGSRAAHRSSWSACVAEVSAGLVDFCPTPTWVLASRREMSSFTAALLTDRQYLMVKKPKTDDSFVANFTFIFLPFKPLVWILTPLAAIVVGLVVVCLQPRPKSEAHADETPAAARRRRRHELLDHVQDNVGSSLVELLTAGSSVEDDDISAVKVLKCGYTFFGLLVITCFQSSLTAFLVRNSYNMPISSMEDCVAKKCTVCITGFLEPEMRTLYTDTINYFVPPPTASTSETFAQWGFEQIRAGNCDAALVAARN